MGIRQEYVVEGESVDASGERIVQVVLWRGDGRVDKKERGRNEQAGDSGNLGGGVRAEWCLLVRWCHWRMGATVPQLCRIRIGRVAWNFGTLRGGTSCSGRRDEGCCCWILAGRGGGRCRGRGNARACLATNVIQKASRGPKRSKETKMGLRRKTKHIN